MKVMLKNTFFFYLLASTITGSFNKFLESIGTGIPLKIIIENIIYIAIGFIFSYLGFLADKKKNVKI